MDDVDLNSLFKVIKEVLQVDVGGQAGHIARLQDAGFINLNDFTERSDWISMLPLSVCNAIGEIVDSPGDYFALKKSEPDENAGTVADTQVEKVVEEADQGGQRKKTETEIMAEAQFHSVTTLGDDVDVVEAGKAEIATTAGSDSTIEVETSATVLVEDIVEDESARVEVEVEASPRDKDESGAGTTTDETHGTVAGDTDAEANDLLREMETFETELLNTADTPGSGDAEGLTKERESEHDSENDSENEGSGSDNSEDEPEEEDEYNFFGMDSMVFGIKEQIMNAPDIRSEGVEEYTYEDELSSTRVAKKELKAPEEPENATTEPEEPQKEEKRDDTPSEVVAAEDKSESAIQGTVAEATVVAMDVQVPVVPPVIAEEAKVEEATVQPTRDDSQVKIASEDEVQEPPLVQVAPEEGVTEEQQEDMVVVEEVEVVAEEHPEEPKEPKEGEELPTGTQEGVEEVAVAEPIAEPVAEPAAEAETEAVAEEATVASEPVAAPLAVAEAIEDSKEAADEPVAEERAEVVETTPVEEAETSDEVVEPTEEPSAEIETAEVAKEEVAVAVAEEPGESIEATPVEEVAEVEVAAEVQAEKEEDVEEEAGAVAEEHVEPTEPTEPEVAVETTPVEEEAVLAEVKPEEEKAEGEGEEEEAVAVAEEPVEPVEPVEAVEPVEPEVAVETTPVEEATEVEVAAEVQAEKEEEAVAVAVAVAEEPVEPVVAVETTPVEEATEVEVETEVQAEKEREEEPVEAVEPEVAVETTPVEEVAEVEVEPETAAVEPVEAVEAVESIEATPVEEVAEVEATPETVAVEPVEAVETTPAEATVVSEVIAETVATEVVKEEEVAVAMAEAEGPVEQKEPEATIETTPVEEVAEPSVEVVAQETSVAKETTPVEVVAEVVPEHPTDEAVAEVVAQEPAAEVVAEPLAEPVPAVVEEEEAVAVAEVVAQEPAAEVVAEPLAEPVPAVVVEEEAEATAETTPVEEVADQSTAEAEAEAGAEDFKVEEEVEEAAAVVVTQEPTAEVVAEPVLVPAALEKEDAVAAAEEPSDAVETTPVEEEAEVALEEHPAEEPSVEAEPAEVGGEEEVVAVVVAEQPTGVPEAEPAEVAREEVEEPSEAAENTPVEPAEPAEDSAVVATEVAEEPTDAMETATLEVEQPPVEAAVEAVAEAVAAKEKEEKDAVVVVAEEPATVETEAVAVAVEEQPAATPATETPVETPAEPVAAKSEAPPAVAEASSKTYTSTDDLLAELDEFMEETSNEPSPKPEPKPAEEEVAAIPTEERAAALVSDADNTYVSWSRMENDGMMDLVSIEEVEEIENEREEMEIMDEIERIEQEIHDMETSSPSDASTAPKPGPGPTAAEDVATVEKIAAPADGAEPSTEDLVQAELDIISKELEEKIRREVEDQLRAEMEEQLKEEEDKLKAVEKAQLEREKDMLAREMVLAEATAKAEAEEKERAAAAEAAAKAKAEAEEKERAAAAEAEEKEKAAAAEAEAEEKEKAAAAEAAAKAKAEAEEKERAAAAEAAAKAKAEAEEKERAAAAEAAAKAKAEAEEKERAAAAEAAAEAAARAKAEAEEKEKESDAAVTASAVAGATPEKGSSIEPEPSSPEKVLTPADEFAATIFAVEESDEDHAARLKKESSVATLAVADKEGKKEVTAAPATQEAEPAKAVPVAETEATELQPAATTTPPPDADTQKAAAPEAQEVAPVETPAAAPTEKPKETTSDESTETTSADAKPEAAETSDEPSKEPSEEPVKGVPAEASAADAPKEGEGEDSASIQDRDTARIIRLPRGKVPTVDEISSQYGLLKAQMRTFSVLYGTADLQEAFDNFVSNIHAFLCSDPVDVPTEQVFYVRILKAKLFLKSQDWLRENPRNELLAKKTVEICRSLKVKSPNLYNLDEKTHFMLPTAIASYAYHKIEDSEELFGDAIQTLDPNQSPLYKAHYTYAYIHTLWAFRYWRDRNYLEGNEKCKTALESWQLALDLKPKSQKYLFWKLSLLVRGLQVAAIEAKSPDDIQERCIEVVKSAAALYELNKEDTRYFEPLLRVLSEWYPNDWPRREILDSYWSFVSRACDDILESSPYDLTYIGLYMVARIKAAHVNLFKEETEQSKEIGMEILQEACDILNESIAEAIKEENCVVGKLLDYLITLSQDLLNMQKNDPDKKLEHEVSIVDFAVSILDKVQDNMNGQHMVYEVVKVIENSGYLRHNRIENVLLTKVNDSIWYKCFLGILYKMRIDYKNSFSNFSEFLEKKKYSVIYYYRALCSFSEAHMQNSDKAKKGFLLSAIEDILQTRELNDCTLKTDEIQRELMMNFAKICLEISKITPKGEGRVPLLNAARSNLTKSRSMCQFMEDFLDTNLYVEHDCLRALIRNTDREIDNLPLIMAQLELSYKEARALVTAYPGMTEIDEEMDRLLKIYDEIYSTIKLLSRTVYQQCFLMKLGGKSVMKKWQLRYFVFTFNRIYYFELAKIKQLSNFTAPSTGQIFDQTYQKQFMKGEWKVSNVAHVNPAQPSGKPAQYFKLFYVKKAYELYVVPLDTPNCPTKEVVVKLVESLASIYKTKRTKGFIEHVYGEELHKLKKKNDVPLVEDEEHFLVEGVSASELADDVESKNLKEYVTRVRYMDAQNELPELSAPTMADSGMETKINKL